MLSTLSPTYLLSFGSLHGLFGVQFYFYLIKLADYRFFGAFFTATVLHTNRYTKFSNDNDPSTSIICTLHSAHTYTQIETRFKQEFLYQSILHLAQLPYSSCNDLLDPCCNFYLPNSSSSMLQMIRFHSHLLFMH